MKIRKVLSPVFEFVIGGLTLKGAEDFVEAAVQKLLGQTFEGKLIAAATMGVILGFSLDKEIRSIKYSRKRFVVKKVLASVGWTVVVLWVWGVRNAVTDIITVAVFGKLFIERLW